MAKPPPPGNVKVNGTAKQDGLSTHVIDTPVTISGEIRSDAQKQGQVRLVVYLSKTKGFADAQRKESGWGGNRTAQVTFDGNYITDNQHYYVRVFTEQRNLDSLSNSSNTDFWTERPPSTPKLVSPNENVTIDLTDGVTLKWKHRDADDKPNDAQLRAQVRWRVPATSTTPPGAWKTRTVEGTDDSYFVDSGTLKQNTFYEWTVRTKDVHSPLWGAWAGVRSFYVIGDVGTPVVLEPANNEGLPSDVEVTLSWKFIDWGDTQTKADIRYRVVPTINGEPCDCDEDSPDYDPDCPCAWIEVAGDINEPGANQEWAIPAWTFVPGFRYEWQVRTYDSGSNQSSWSESGYFYAIRTPGWMAEKTGPVVPTVPQGTLGTGTYRFFVYDQGGQRIMGEVTGITQYQWSRVRDDISACTLFTTGSSVDCSALMSELRCWAHEIVAFRDGVRVWEGPITRLGYHDDNVEIEARDPMIYVYRRIMRQGYNDNYRIVRRSKSGEVLEGTGPRSVVDRAAIIIRNALAPHDPNVLPWLTRFDYANDAEEARSVPDWAKTAWEEVDSLAATAGLDYTTVGRRIILHDTHRPIGLLAEMTNKDFFDSPVITEYGMSAANVFGVTNGSGLHGAFAYPQETTVIDGQEIPGWGGVGPIEMLASEYGETESIGSPRTLTGSERRHRVQSLNRQAAANINGRWPPPLVARIADNSQLHPEANVGIQQLVPGVHIPLRAKTPYREFAQVQKLDSVTVFGDMNTQEKVQVIMSPAPLEGLDPDADGVGEVE
jgi:hypothetical protein